MVRRHVLHALAAGIEAADEDVARKALARIDWILRGRARRRLEAALLEAVLKTGVSDYTAPAAVRHVLRAAALIVRGETSDLLSAQTASRMLAKLPKAELVTVPGIGHAPILEEPEAAAGIDRLLEKVLAEDAISRPSAA